MGYQNRKESRGGNILSDSKNRDDNDEEDKLENESLEKIIEQQELSGKKQAIVPELETSKLDRPKEYKFN